MILKLDWHVVIAVSCTMSTLLQSEQDARIEALREKYRPRVMYTLFVAELAPANGKFFYCGNTTFKRFMQKAFDAAYGSGNVPFLTRFEAFGWYLDDLVLTPVNKLEDRKERCRAARGSLAKRINSYQPQMVVSLLRRIDDDVRAASGSLPFRPMSFPGNSHQGKLLCEMVRMRDELPRARI